MPNGKPGDHPLTDILIHGHEVFGAQIHALIGQLDEHGLWESPIASDWLYERYWDYRETQQRGGEADVRRVLEHLESRLSAERHRLGGDLSDKE